MNCFISKSSLKCVHNRSLYVSKLQWQLGWPTVQIRQLTWYSRSCLAMSCLALCSASSRSLVRALASFTASSPRSSASPSWFSRLPRWGGTGDKKPYYLLSLNHSATYIRSGCIFPVAVPELSQPLSRSAVGWSVGWPRPPLPSRCGARLRTDWPAPTFGRTTDRRKVNFSFITAVCLWIESWGIGPIERFLLSPVVYLTHSFETRFSWLRSTISPLDATKLYTLVL